MIEAGKGELANGDLRFDLREEIVTRIYLAMTKARIISTDLDMAPIPSKPLSPRPLEDLLQAARLLEEAKRQ